VVTPRVNTPAGPPPAHPRDRAGWARDTIGARTELFVDANGAFEIKEAQAWAEWYGEQGVSWLEEPVSSDDGRGLAHLRRAGPPGLRITAGENGWDLFALRRLLDVDAVDVLQPDVTRCGGYTTFLRADALCRARNVPLSAHCAPAQSVHAVCASETAVHLEYFHDHVRVESLLFDGTLEPQPGGVLVPDLDRPGNGLELKHTDLERYAL
jgi:L-alanine-DL-glutamate epimerase-like enolase superfamily enzyme